MPNSLTIAVLCEEEQTRNSIANKIGKKASSDDLSFYHTVFSGKIINVVQPAAYPGKLSSLLESINLCDVALVVADKLSAPLGEIIVSLSLMKIPTIFISNIDLTKILNGTNLKESKIFNDEQSAIEYLLSIEPKLIEGSPVAYIDHCFEVKGVGTVALGVVKQGEIKVHDKLTAYSQDIPIEIKSIQKNDADVLVSTSSDRVGLAIKGAKSDQIPRGTILSEKPIVVTTKISGNFSISPFVKEIPKENDVIHGGIGLNLQPARIIKVQKNDNEYDMDLEFEKPIAFAEFSQLLICNLNAKTLRVLGISSKIRQTV